MTTTQARSSLFSLAEVSRRFAIGVLLVGLVAACVAENGPTAEGPPDRSGWPPVDTAPNAPTGLVLQVSGSTVTVSNGSGDAVWVSPPLIEIWTGPDPWTTSTDIPDGAAQLKPGQQLSREIETSPAAVRAGVTVYPEWPAPPGTQPWFLWIEVPPPSTP